MTKPKLILQPNEFTSFTSWYLESLWREYFDIEYYDCNKTYSKKDLFVCWMANSSNQHIVRLANTGHKIVVDHLWELLKSSNQKNFFYLACLNWFRYNEALWWHALGYNNYQPNKQIKKSVLMPIRRQSSDRNKVVQALEPWLGDFLYSYGSTVLPNDLDKNNLLYQRYFNELWYDQTYMSFVVETSTGSWPTRFVTEKTYKPMAYYHPFVVIASPEHLNCLKQQGFETFDNLFDESYDQISSFDQRLAIIIENIKSVIPGMYDAETQRRLEHNHNHFFNLDIARAGIVKEIIEPLLHYAET